MIALNLRHLSTSLGAVTAISAIACTLAAPAIAAGNLVDNGNGTITATGVNGSGANGLWFCSPATVATACTGSNYDYGNHFDSGVYQVGSQVYTPTSPGMVSLPAGTYNVQLVDAPNASISLSNVFIGTVPTPEPTSTPQSPPPVLQAFAASSTASCDERAQDSLNWGGASAGGWSESWQQWVNGGAGGTACQRTLTYNVNTRSWDAAR